MKPKFPLSLVRQAVAISAILSAASPQAFSATIEKADNSDQLNLSTSWVGGVVPGAQDVAQWSATVTSANSVTLGSNIAVGGLSITSPAGAVQIAGANTLTLGKQGIDMSAATQDLTIGASVTLAATAQSWNVATGRTLTLNTGTFSRSAGATLVLPGAGNVVSTQTGLTSAALTNAILPWGAVGTGTASRFPTFSGNNLVGYTAATVQSTAGGAWGGIPSGGTGLINYDITISGTPGQTGLGRNVSSLRYTGTGLVQQGNNTAILLNTNAILNAGTGVFSFATGGGSIYGIAPSSTNELVLNAANVGITVNAYIANNGANAGNVTVTGTSPVILSGTNTFTGNLTVNGILNAGTGQGATPAASNLGALQPAANRNIIINNGGVLTLTAGNVLGTGASTNTLANTTLVVNAGGEFRTGLDGAAAGWWNKIGATTLNGGKIIVGSGANTTNFQALALIGTVTATGNQAVSIEKFANSNNTSNAIHLGQNAATGQSITFDVADVTASAATDLSISTRLINTSADLAASGFTKTGAGTMTLTAINGYTGPTVISAGTLQLGDGLTEGSIATSNGITNNAQLVHRVLGSQTYPNPLSGTGAMTVTGGGSLAFSSASNAFLGSTLLESGNLKLNGTFGSISIADDSFNVLGVTTGGTVNASSLSFAGDAVFSLPASFSLGGSPFVSVSGALSTTPANGVVTVNVNSTPLVNGTYPLISAGSFSGNLSDFQLQVDAGINSRQSAALALSGTSINLVVSGDSPKWTGAVNGNWTTSTISNPKNWKLITANAATDFLNLDNVLFDDSATGSTALELSDGDISAGLITFSNQSKNYSISSTTGYFINQGTLTKNGAGSLTISTNNLFSAPTTFTGGSLILGDAGALGAVTLNIEEGLSKSIDNSFGSALTLTGNSAQNWNDNFTFIGTNDLDMGNGVVTLGGLDLDRTIAVQAGVLTVGEVKSTTHGLIKQGNGILAFASQGAGIDASVLAGPLNVSAGTVQINRTASDAAGSGDFTVTGIEGTGTIANGSAVERWLVVNPATDQEFLGALVNGGTGGLGLNKRGTSQLTLSGAISYTGTTTVDGGNLVITAANSGAGSNAVVNSGKLVINHPQALGAASTVRLAGNNLAQLDLAVDGGLNVYGLGYGTGTNATIFSNRATEGAGINHTMSTIGINGVGGGILTIAAGDKVTSGTARLTLAEFGLSAGSVQTTAVNPTTASVTIGNVSKVANAPVQTLELSGSSSDNFVTGLIANGTSTISLVKSGSSTWTISGANNTYSGNTTIGTANGAGVLRVTASGALGTGVIGFDGSGGAPGPTSRLELLGDITLANAITLNQRNNTSANILNVSGNNVLTGNINLNVGGASGNIESASGLLTLSGGISTTTTAIRTIRLGGAGNGLVSGVISNNAGTMSVVKAGAGIWTLSATNTFTGTTTISEGTLVISGDSPTATGAVSVAANATLAGNGDLGGSVTIAANGIHALSVAASPAAQATRTIGGVLDLSAVGDVLQLSAASTPAPGAYTLVTATGGITGQTSGVLNDTVLQLSGLTGTVAVVGNDLILTVAGAATTYSSWASSYGLDPATTGLASADPDGDGQNNALEFALGGSPVSGGNLPKIYSLIADSDADVDATKELVLTIAVPQGTPAFGAGAPASTATFEGTQIAVKGSETLTSFPLTVSPVTAVITGLPAAPVQGGVTYEYRSFSLGNSNGTPTKGFMRVEVTTP